MHKSLSFQKGILSFQQAAELIALCEQGAPNSPIGSDGQPVDSWLDYCEQFHIFQFFTQEFVEAIAELIQDISPYRVLEICAGSGQLSTGLQNLGIDVIAIDIQSETKNVEKLTVGEALVHYKPDFVIGCWVPFDIGLDLQVLRYPSVRFYLYINQVVNGVLGPEAMWREPNWQAKPLKEIDRFGLCRFDFFIGLSALERNEIVQHSRAIIFERTL